MAGVSREAEEAPVPDRETEPEGARCEEDFYPVPTTRKTLPDVVDSTQSDSEEQDKTDTGSAEPDSEPVPEENLGEQDETETGIAQPESERAEQRQDVETSSESGEADFESLIEELDSESEERVSTFLESFEKSQFMTFLKSFEKIKRELIEKSKWELKDRRKVGRKKLQTSTEFSDFEIDSDDLNKSGSQWNEERFMKYFKKLQISYTTLSSEVVLSHRIGKRSGEIMKEYVKLALVWTDLTKDDLAEKRITKTRYEAVIRELLKKKYPEATMRTFINAFFNPLMEEHGLKLNAEELVQSSKKLPSNKLDYAVYFTYASTQLGVKKTTTVPIGCIEAKSCNGLMPKSIFQCMLQLLSLRTKTKNTIFNILTDGIHFVFLKYNKDDVFELETSKGENVAAIYNIETEKNKNNLQRVVAIVDEMLQEGKRQVQTKLS